MTTSRLALLTVSSTLALALMATPAAIDWGRLQPAANLAQAADAIAAGDRASTGGSSHAAVEGAESHAAGGAEASPGAGGTGDASTSTGADASSGEASGPSGDSSTGGGAGSSAGGSTGTGASTQAASPSHKVNLTNNKKRQKTLGSTNVVVKAASAATATATVGDSG